METDFNTADALAQEQASWVLAACPIEEDASSFGAFTDIVRMWRGKRGTNGAFPNRAEFDFFEFQGWWGRIAIAEVKRAPFGVRYSLWGTQLTEWWGVDYTNKLLGDASIVPHVWRSTERRYFEEIARAPFIGAVLGRLEVGDEPAIQVVGLDMPLSEDGVISHVLSAFTKADTDRALSEIADDFPISRTFEAR